MFFQFRCHLTTLAISKVLALVKEYVGMGKKNPKTVLSLGETATIFCFFLPYKLLQNTVISAVCRTAAPAA